MTQQDRKKAREALREVWDKMRGEDPDVIKMTIAKAVKALRSSSSSKMMSKKK